MEIVVDASLGLTWCLHDEEYPGAAQLLDKCYRSPMHIPQHWALEVSNGLVMAMKRGRITESEIYEALAFLTVFDFIPDAFTASAAKSTALALAIRHKLTLYDAAYLELALRLGHPLATLDQKLAKAAEEEGVVIVKIES